MPPQDLTSTPNTVFSYKNRAHRDQVQQKHQQPTRSDLASHSRLHIQLLSLERPGRRSQPTMPRPSPKDFKPKPTPADQTPRDKTAHHPPSTTFASRKFFVFILLNVYTLFHGAGLIAQTVTSWYTPSTMPNSGFNQEFAELLMKSVSAYTFVVALGWLVSQLLWP